MSPSEKSSDLEQLTHECNISTETLCWQLFDEIPIPLFTLDVSLQFLFSQPELSVINGLLARIPDWSIGSPSLLSESSYGAPESFLKTQHPQGDLPASPPTSEFDLLLKSGGANSH